MKAFIFALVPALSATLATAEPADSDWTGFYAGLHYGYEDVYLGWRGRDYYQGSTDGIGLHGGYLRDLGPHSVGVEADWSRLDDADMIRLRAKGGVEFGRYMPYLVLGVARFSGANSDVTDTAFSWGIGADLQVTPQFSVGLEYSRQEFSGILDDPALGSVDLDVDMVQLRGSYRF